LHKNWQDEFIPFDTLQLYKSISKAVWEILNKMPLCFYLQFSVLHLLPQVRIVVLPTKRKRFKTKVQHINSPRFSETFKLSHVSPEDLRGLGLRIRLYGIGKVTFVGKQHAVLFTMNCQK